MRATCGHPRPRRSECAWLVSAQHALGSGGKAQPVRPSPSAGLSRKLACSFSVCPHSLPSPPRSVHKWAVEAREPPASALPVSPRSPAAGGAAPPPIAGSHFVAGPSAAARARLVFDLHGELKGSWLGSQGPSAARGQGDASLAAAWLPRFLHLWPPASLPALLRPLPPAATRPVAQQVAPAAATPGFPPIQHAAVLTDRRHVLTQDAEGRVLQWDVTAGGWSLPAGKPLCCRGQLLLLPCDASPVPRVLWPPPTLRPRPSAPARPRCRRGGARLGAARADGGAARAV